MDRFATDVAKEDVKKTIEHEIKSLIEMKLFLEVCFMVKDKGKLSDFAAELDGYHCTMPTKYSFLNQLITFGVLKPYKTENWGSRELIEYKLDKEKLYSIYITTDLGSSNRKLFKERAVLLDKMW